MSKVIGIDLGTTQKVFAPPPQLLPSLKMVNASSDKQRAAKR